MDSQSRFAEPSRLSPMLPLFLRLLLALLRLHQTHSRLLFERFWMTLKTFASRLQAVRVLIRTRRWIARTTSTRASSTIWPFPSMKLFSSRTPPRPLAMRRSFAWRSVTAWLEIPPPPVPLTKSCLCNSRPESLLLPGPTASAKCSLPTTFISPPPFNSISPPAKPSNRVFVWQQPTSQHEVSMPFRKINQPKTATGRLWQPRGRIPIAKMQRLLSPLFS